MDNTALTGEGVERRAQGPASLYDAFSHWTITTPHALALSSSQERYTYAQLGAWAEAVEGELLSAGVAPGDLIGVLMHRSTELVACLLALLRLGAAYMVLDPNDPPDRRKLLTTRAGVSKVVSTIRPAPSEHSLTPGPFARSRVESRRSTDDLAYVNFTSGSTGLPKPVAVPQSAVLRLAHAPAWIEVRASDRFLLVSPATFDASTFELWTPLTNGAALHIAPPSPLDLDALAECIRDQDITVVMLVTGLLNQMVNHHLSAFGSVRHVLMGGDVASPVSINALVSAVPGIAVTNGYGPTESTTFAACWTSSEGVVGPVPIGTPIDSTDIVILGPDASVLPDGETGELFIGGAGLAWGYLGMPAETARAFVPDPRAGRKGERLYATGDLGARDKRGQLHFGGRRDWQGKVRGIRVEPGEVEALLLAHDLVALAAAVVREVEGQKHLAAFVVPTGAAMTADGLPEALLVDLRGRAPRHLVPATITVLSEMPTTLNGKLDRSALPDPVSQAASEEQGQDVEGHITAIWTRILHESPADQDANFFEAGGHSLTAVDLLDEIHRVLGINISARQLYEKPTKAGLVESVRRSLLERSQSTDPRKVSRNA